MMGKRNLSCKDDDEKLIYKNSNNTFNTYSKVCSSASKIFTKSLIMELRKIVSNSVFYECNGKLKRDISIETDVCRIKGFFKKKMRKPAHRLAISENRCSTNNTEIDTIEDFQPDSSGCGDSKPNLKRQDTHFNIDLTALVMDNLKGLLNDWIKKYLLENNETKQKIETVLDSILHKLEIQATKTSSSCTYTLDIEIVDREVSSNISESYMDNQKHTKRSHYTIPLRGKHLKLISTLSVPRNFKNVNKKSLHRINKQSNKYLYVSMKRNSKSMLDTSSLNILSVSTKSLTRRCATYQKTKHDKHVDDKWATYVPRPSSTLCTSVNNEDKKETINVKQKTKVNNKEPVVYKSISLNPIDLDKKISKQKTTLIEEQNNTDSYLPLNMEAHADTAALNILKLDLDRPTDIQKHKSSILRIDFRNQNIDFLDLIMDKINKRKQKYSTKESNLHTRKKLQKKRPSKKNDCHKADSKNHSCLFKKSELLIDETKEKEMLKHFQNVLQYFSTYSGNKDLKFDIHINVFSDRDKNKNKEESSQAEKCDSVIVNVCNDPSKTITNLMEDSCKQTSESSIKPIIIPLLDGAASHAKYLISRETSTDNCDQLVSKENHNTIETKNINIAHEISELRGIVKDLTITAEKFVKINFSNKNIPKKSSNAISDKKYKIEDVKLKCFSRGIQISNITAKSNITSGVKLKKSPKRKSPKDFNPRLVKRSTSYHIFDSETILRVTDMTSAAADGTTEKVTDEALTCSFPKSKSLFEVSVGSNKHKLLAFYCDDFVKPDYVYNKNMCSLCSCVQCPSRNQCFHIKPSCSNHFSPNQSHYTVESCNKKERCMSHDGFNPSSSVLIDVCEKPSEKKFVIHNREVGCWEGCCYCILLWIPVLIITWLLYVYVLKDVIKKISTSRPRNDTRRYMISPSEFPLKLSDLGF